MDGMDEEDRVQIRGRRKERRNEIAIEEWGANKVLGYTLNLD